MKNLFLSLLFLGFFGAMQAQVVELKEARVILSVDDWRLDPNTNSVYNYRSRNFIQVNSAKIL